MRIKEYIGKEIFKKYGIKVPKSYLVRRTDSFYSLRMDFEEVVLKAQVLIGNRRKNNLIIFSSKEDLIKNLKEIFDKNVEEVLIEEKIDVIKELYLSAFLDTYERKLKLLFSDKGGIDISEANEIDLNKIENLEIKIIAEKLLKIAVDYDAELVEINPLALTKNGFIALDAKIIIDDNSLYKHEDILKYRIKEIKSEIEKIAFENDIHFVDLNGEVGILGVGAGLTMATMDLIDNPAFFMDIGGGASVEKMKAALKIIKIRKPKKVIFNIFGGITRCDEIAKAIVEEKIDIPFFIRIVGTNEIIAKKILEENGIKVLNSLDELL
ncbi:MAG: ATP-grasp domain-containing protein [Candidatus Aenigmatarchaeota archaeon]